ncbi:MAG TPA: DUF1572 family protein [Sediminibacterium sp.]|uniref:DUF1572 family protein n=1 Tax=Sediminibacterium sp. TaxID=1917865 RepID=UPI0008D53692|nr:DUF1572 family protein [Sediminibacterium sp.]OHC85878.1 MAG: hypothetical protein A2472_09110 [Sphingobacteriia bacterium RIFOXYC2_FULL_35_18]OHC87413.1 MAG: hypothetical protein A2546_05265 [Sphingobacteriia bacterium RIFOXYD2_FULL_35_12]HLD52458.1 DUF1572 family protein [Sediminibacterium sp.]
MQNEFINSAKHQFEYYKQLAEKTFSRLTEDQLFWKYNEESNSIATIVKHMNGNMLSRWTDLFTTDGEKDWRMRDEEFENDIFTRAELLSKWEDGWNCLYKVLDNLTIDDLDRVIFIRQQPLTVTAAINRQLAHYPYHVGQIVFIGKMLCDTNWESLSIPKKTT